MSECTRTHSVAVVGPGGGFFSSDADAPPALATVGSGVYSEPLPVVGLTVGEVRRRFHDRLDIDPQSQAFLDGQEVGDEVVIRAGQGLLFARRAGEKGLRP